VIGQEKNDGQPLPFASDVELAAHLSFLFDELVAELTEGATNNRYRLSAAILVSAVSLHSEGLRHGQGASDRHHLRTRVAADLLYWILKVKPISLSEDLENLGEFDFFINEMFGAKIYFWFLGIDASSLGRSYYFRFLHYLRHSPASQDSLFLIGESLLAGKIEGEDYVSP